MIVILQREFSSEEEEEKKKKLRNKLIAAGVGTAALATGLGIYLAKKGKGKINYKNNGPLHRDLKEPTEKDLKESLDLVNILNEIYNI